MSIPFIVNSLTAPLEPADNTCFAEDGTPDSKNLSSVSIYKLTPLDYFKIFQPLDFLQYGCTNWDACDFDTQDSWTIGNECYSEGEDTWSQFYLNGVIKTKWDEAYKTACCVGSFTDPVEFSKYCDATWRPTDPNGSCTFLAQKLCSTASECSKSALLVPNFGSADPEKTFCNTWYLSVRDAGSTHPSYNALYNMIDTYCMTDGARNGECACYNTHASITQNQEPPFLSIQSSKIKNAIHRVDMYCSPTSAYQDPKFCGPNATPVNPTPDLVGMPTHCWAMNCQGNKDTEMFWDPSMFDTKCPDVCMQFSANNAISINEMSVSNAIVIDGMVSQCSENAGTQQTTTPFQVKDASGNLELVITQPPNQITTYTANLTNQSSDKYWSSMSSVAFAVSCSLNPLVTSTATGTLTSGGTSPFQYVVNTTGSEDGTNVFGELLIQDPTGANGWLEVPIQIMVDEQSTSAIRTQTPSGSGGFGWFWAIIALGTGLVLTVELLFGALVIAFVLTTIIPDIWVGIAVLLGIGTFRVSKLVRTAEQKGNVG